IPINRETNFQEEIAFESQNTPLRQDEEESEAEDFSVEIVNPHGAERPGTPPVQTPSSPPKVMVIPPTPPKVVTLPQAPVNEPVVPPTPSNSPVAGSTRKAFKPLVTKPPVAPRSVKKTGTAILNMGKKLWSTLSRSSSTESDLDVLELSAGDTKQLPEGGIRRKARLVVKGCGQRPGVDYKETFAPVVRYETVRILLATAASMNLQLRQFDVNTAFLNTDLEEEIYMKQPKGYEVQRGNYVCKLQRGLYGLKQSPRNWHKTLKLALTELGFMRCAYDNCLFIYQYGENTRIYIAIYVDDGLMAGNDPRLMDSMLEDLSKKFEMKISPDVKKFLGLEISRDKRGIMVHQEDYIQTVAKRFGLENCKSVGIPLQPYRELDPDPTGASHDPSLEFQEIVGALLFVMRCCRPDVAYAVNKLSRYFQNYEKKHMEAAKEVLRYLRTTRNMGIRYFPSQRDNQLVGYCDADFGSDRMERKSTTGVIFTFNESPLTWLSRKQTIIALSTTEAEYVAAATACKEGIWLKNVLEDIAVVDDPCVTIYTDSQSGMQL
ncbi:unnamed protein product, partial [Allacma fusca]